MPKYIQPILVGKKRYYAVYSTIVMDFITPYYPSLKALRKAHPEYRNLKVAREPLRGRIRDDGRLEVSMKVYRIDIKELKDLLEKRGGLHGF
jgi:hypothetical protein